MASLPASTAIAAARGYPDLHDHIDTLREAARVVTKRLRLAAQVMRANAGRRHVDEPRFDLAA